MPELVLKLGDTVVQTYVFDKDIMSIGRSRENDVVVENLSVSRNHARIRRQNGKFVLTDLNSANGTYVNGVRVTKTDLRHDDVVSVGKHKITFLKSVSKRPERKPVEEPEAVRTVLEKSPAGVPLLVVTDGKLKGREFPLTKFETSIGKAQGNDIMLGDDWFLSKKQAVIYKRGNDFEIHDLGGIRKTKVNGETLAQPRHLRAGDVVELGNTRVMYQGADASSQVAVPAYSPSALTARPDPPSKRPPSRSPTEHEPDVVVEPWPEDKAKAEAAQVSPTSPDSAPAIGEGNGSVPPPPSSAPVLQDLPAPVSDESGSRASSVSFSVNSKSGTSARRASKRERAGQAASAEGGDSASPQSASPSPASDFHRASEYAPAAPASDAGRDEPATHAIAAVGVSDLAASSADVAPAPATVDFPAGLDESSENLELPDPNDPEVAREIALWQAALNNRSAVIRKQAARMLKKLTGRDHEF